jgi:hypothetical protein
MRARFSMVADTIGSVGLVWSWGGPKATDLSYSFRSMLTTRNRTGSPKCRVNHLTAVSRAREGRGAPRARQQSAPPMPRRATRARRIPFSVGPFSVGGCRMVPTPGQRYRGRRDGLDIEAGGGVVVAPFSVGPFSVGGCRMVPTPGQLRGQPDNTPHRNGTDDRALGRALALAFPAGAIGLFIWAPSGATNQAERQTDPHPRRPTTWPIPFSPNGSGRPGAGARMVMATTAEARG